MQEWELKTAKRGMSNVSKVEALAFLIGEGDNSVDSHLCSRSFSAAVGPGPLSNNLHCFPTDIQLRPIIKYHHSKTELCAVVVLSQSNKALATWPNRFEQNDTPTSCTSHLCKGGIL